MSVSLSVTLGVAICVIDDGLRHEKPGKKRDEIVDLILFQVGC